MAQVLYNPFDGIEYKPFEKQYCIFEILDNGTWYKIDMALPRPEYFPDIPAGVVNRANEAKYRGEDRGGTLVGFTVDPAPYYEEALREEFDGVRFIGTDFIGGAVY